jgi:gas vesicle protein
MTKWKFLKGALLGLLAGILIAPKSGKKLREDAKKYYHEISDRISDELAKMKVVTRETYEQVVNSVVAVYQDTKKITAREAEQIKKTLQAGYENIAKAHTEEIKKQKPSA